MEQSKMACEVPKCRICLDSLKDRSYVPLVKRDETCRHVFHFHCLKKWTETCGLSSLDHGHPSCPCCRRKILWIYPVNKGAFYEVKYREYLNGSQEIIIEFEIIRIGMCQGLDDKFKPIELIPMHALGLGNTRATARNSVGVQTPPEFYNDDSIEADDDSVVEVNDDSMAEPNDILIGSLVPAQGSEEAYVFPNVEPGPVPDMEAGLGDQVEAESSDSETVQVDTFPNSAAQAEHNGSLQNPVTLGLILAAIVLVVAIMGYQF